MILFVSQDAGPTEYLCRIISALNKNIKYYCFSSEVSDPIFQKNGIKTTSESEVSNSQLELIVTGTCWADDGLDKKWIKKSKELNIPCISIIENWSCYSKRFFDGKNYFYPDYIFTNDAIAKDEAANEGIPIHLMQIMGNPVLEEWQSTTSGEILKRNDILEAWEVPKDKKIVLFVSEEYRQDYGQETPFYPGFDEYQVIKDIMEVMPDNWHLIIKKHPAEPQSKYIEYQGITNVTLLNRTNINWVRKIPDILIGMGSMLLIEAGFERRDVISYRPNQLTPFIGNKLGVTNLILNKTDLANIFYRGLVPSLTPDLMPNFRGSTQNIIKFLERIL